MITNQAFDIAAGIAMYLDTHAEYDGEDDISCYDDAVDELRKKVRRGTEKFGYRVKVKASSGCYRTAFIFRDFVIKLSLKKYRIGDLRDEYKFISKMRKNKSFGRHFPETHIVQAGNVYVQIQEKVDMSHRGRNTRTAEQLGEVLGLDDMHTGNFGWKGRQGREYPVYVDVDFRAKNTRLPRKRKTKIRSWEMVAIANRSY